MRSKKEIIKRIEFLEERQKNVSFREQDFIEARLDELEWILE